MLKLKLQIHFDHLMEGSTTLFEKTMLGKITGKEGAMKDRDSWITSLRQFWTWVWVDSGSWSDGLEYHNLLAVHMETRKWDMTELNWMNFTHLGSMKSNWCSFTFLPLFENICLVLFFFPKLSCNGFLHFYFWRSLLKWWWLYSSAKMFGRIHQWGHLGPSIFSC